MPCPPGDQEEAVLRCGFFVGFPWISKVKTWPQASSSSTHHKRTPPLLQPMETAEPIELSPWQHTLQPPKRLQVGGWDYRCMGKIMGLTPKGWYEHIRTNNPSYLREHIERFRNLSRRLHQLQSKQHCHWYTCSLEYHTTIMSYKSQLKM